MNAHPPVLVQLRERTLAHVLLELREARRDWEEATGELERGADPEADDHCTCSPWGNPPDDPYYQCTFCEQKVILADADDRAGLADERIDALREEFACRFAEATGLTWRQIETAISEALL